MELSGWGPFIGACGTVFGAASAFFLGWLKNRNEAAAAAAVAATAAAAQKASPYEALAARVVQLETSDSAKHAQIVNLSSKVMTLEATSESRRVLLYRAKDRHEGVVAHVDNVEAWMDQQAVSGYPRLDPELRAPVPTA